MSKASSVDREGRVLKRLRRDNVDEMRVVDRLAREATVAGEARGEFAPDHARRADDEHLHQKLPPFAARIIAGQRDRRNLGRFRRSAYPRMPVKLLRVLLK